MLNFLPSDTAPYVSGTHARKLTYAKYVTMIPFLYLIAEAAGIVLGILPFEGTWALSAAYREEISILIIAILVVFLTLSIFIHRPWCGHLCPFGTLLSLFNQFSILSLRRN